jgi:hypothetical protein
MRKCSLNLVCVILMLLTAFRALNCNMELLISCVQLSIDIFLDPSCDHVVVPAHTDDVHALIFRFGWELCTESRKVDKFLSTFVIISLFCGMLRVFSFSCYMLRVFSFSCYMLLILSLFYLSIFMLEVYPELSSPGISISDNSELGMACWHFSEWNYGEWSSVDFP